MNDIINKKIIDDFIKENNLTKTKFCKLCRISVGTFNRIMNDQNFKLNAVFKVAKVMNVKLYELFI